MPTVDINMWAVLVAGIANMVLGMLWFSPATGLGRAWMKEMRMDPSKIEEAKKKGMGKSYAIAFAAALVMAYVFSHVLDFAQAESVKEGLQGAFWMWLGFIATVGVGMVLWEGRSWKLYGIVMSYWLVALLVQSAVLVSWV